MIIISKIIQEIENLKLQLTALFTLSKLRVSNKVNFVSQFGNPEWAEKILKDGESKRSDPDWQNSGAKDIEEYVKWVTTMCGMACTVMAIDFFVKEKRTTLELARLALTHAVYDDCDDKLSDMKYKEYVEWVNQRSHIRDLHGWVSNTFFQTRVWL